MLTIIVATEKESDKLHVAKTKRIVAVTLILLFFIGITSVNAENNNNQVILGGTPFGLKIFTNGVLVIEVDENNSPAKNAGIKVNDIITKADNTVITSNEQLKSIIENSFGKKINLTVLRDSTESIKTIVPQKNSNNNYVIGMWIRDSTAGIGTVTYFDPNNSTFGALGHGICDKDTNMLMPLRNGEITSATISNCTKGTDGVIGGLNGYFNPDKIGDITANNGYGIYGKYQYTDCTRYVEIAKDEEIKTGKASILSTIEGTTPKEFSVEIIRINLNENNGQNMIIKVTDDELIDKTGGIVQGMSGSPILQNGKLIGAVTHVFINSPQKGYGISISNMLKYSSL